MSVMAIRCPQCGAKLDVAGDADVATCAYCGTTSRVQKRSRVLQIPVPPPQVPTAQRTYPVATQMRTTGFKAGCLVGVLALVGGGLSIGWCVKKKFFDQVGWDGLGAPILYDVNGDGTADAVGRTRYVRSGDRMHLAAIDGRDGSLLWESPKLGTYMDTYQDKIMLAGDMLLIGDQAGGLSGWDPKHGKQLWRTELGERTEGGCAGGEGAALVQTTDKRWHRVTVADGARVDATEPGRCAALASYSNVRPVAVGIEVGDHWTEGLPHQVTGMQVDKYLRRAPDGPWVAVGYRYPGTNTPMAALLKDGQPVWSVVIPERPLEAGEGAPDFATLSKDVLLVVYEGRKTQSWRLASFALTTGLRRWDVSVPTGFMGVASGVVASASHVFVSLWGRLEVFDLATGNHRYSVGE